MSDLHCPNCDAVLDMRLVLKSREEHDAFDRLLLAIGIPLMRRVLDYIDLHKPAMQRLSMTKKVKLIRSLTPDLERQAITRVGRDWPVPPALWAQAIDQMLATRDAGRLDLPLKGHGYLYAVLQGLADKAEAVQEHQAEELRRTGTTTRPTVQVRGQAVNAGHALPAIDATLAALDQRDRTAAPMPVAVRQKLAELRSKPTPIATSTDTKD